MTTLRRILLPALFLTMTCSPLRAVDRLTIRVEEKVWGDADADDIRAVLESVARELFRVAPPADPIRIKVVPSKEAPQVDYRRGADGEFTVRLASKDRQWSQFAFQFGHELAHILSHYERRNENKVGSQNQWFEETICEAASLFVLARMSESWKTAPPYRNWKSYASSLGDYGARRLKEVEAPDADAMPKWFADNRPALRSDPYLRDRNRVVAAHLFRLLEKDTSRWQAMSYLNLGRPDKDNTFEAYIENWYFSVPRVYKPFVKEVVDLLGVKSEAITAHASK